MEKEIVEKTDLLDEERHITVEGWARYPYWRYERKKLNASALRIKEWDYYQILNRNEKYFINLTFSDLGLFSMISISYVDYRRADYAMTSALKFFTKNRMGLAESPEDDYAATYADENITLSIIKKGAKRQIIANCPRMRLPDGRTGLLVDAVIYDEMKESMNIATSWKEDRRRFYYNEKRGPMRAEGSIMMDMERSSLDGCLALLDWGRGLWLRSSTWLWSAVMGEHDGKLFMLNLGYGFTDRSPASENCIICDGRVHKIEEVEITIPEDYEKEKWSIKDRKGRLYLEMLPIINRKDHQDYKLIVSKQDQVFGYINGYFILDEGERIDIKEEMGFIEKVYNKW